MNEKNTGPQPNAGKPRHYNRKPRQNKAVDALSQAVQSAIELVKEPAGGEKRKQRPALKKEQGAAEATMRAASRRHSRQTTSRHRKQRQSAAKPKNTRPRTQGRRKKDGKKPLVSHYPDGVGL